jgi:hypothetical protein
VKRSEDAALIEIYSTLSTMSGLFPPNPADVTALSKNLRAGARAAGHLMQAVFYVRSGDLDLSRQEVNEARLTLGIPQYGEVETR